MRMRMGQIMTDSDTTGVSTSDELDALLAQLSPDQIRYVIARRENKDVTSACAAINMSRNTYYCWPEETRNLIDKAVRLMLRDGVVTAMHLRRRALAEAMAVKIAGLRSANERIRQQVATEIIDGSSASAADTGHYAEWQRPHRSCI